MPPGFSDLIGSSSGLVALRGQLQQLVRRYAAARRLPPLLLLGETGTGKNLIARALHAEGPRAGRPFVEVNCAAIPETLMEAEMFGFERGAFTDARQSKPGLFATADGGTIFLDEIGLLPESLQAKLLKVVEDRQFRPLGGTTSKSVDVWIIAATSEDLGVALRRRRFREDLYHRLAVVTVRVPPLRERGEDVIVLAEHLLARACADYGIGRKIFTPAAVAALRAHPWPGNIRELSNVIERVALLSDASSVTAQALGLSTGSDDDPPSVDGGEARPRPGIDDAVSALEREHLSRALASVGGNVTRAAARLGLTRNAFRYRLRKHGLQATPGATTTVPPSTATAPRSATAIRWERRRLAFLRVALVPVREDAEPQQRMVLDEIVQKALGFGGTLDSLGPTGATAVFGLDFVEDAARRAAHAAMAIRALAARARDVDDGAPRVKLALHAPQALLGKTPDGVHVDMGARREIWHALDALVAGAAGDSIIVDASAAAALRGTFQLQERDDGSAWLRDGERVVAWPRDTTVFVGRTDEMALVRGRLALALAGRGQVVAIDGEPGIGKSRLLFEFARTLDVDTVGFLLARSVSHGRELPLLPIIELVRRAHDIHDGDDAERIRDRMRSKLTSLGLPADEMSPYLLRLLGVSEGAASIAHLAPQEVHHRTLEVVRTVLLAGSRVRPLVLAVEDLHWMDRASERYLAALVDGVAEARVLLLTTSRTGQRSPWSEKSYVTELRLQPLSRNDSRRVLDVALGTGGAGVPLSPATAEAILDRADGNPFFLEELATAMGSTAGGATSVPESVEAVLLARIDRLANDPKAVLQAASVIGRDVPVPLLEAITSDLAKATDHLHELQRLDYLHLRADAGQPLYRFKHALTQEVAYSSMLPEHRCVLHGRVMAAIEAEHGGRLGEHAESLAHHAVRGQRWGKALRYLRDAGLRAFDRSAHHEAVASLEKALEVVSRLPPHETAEAAIELRINLFWPLVAIAEYHRALDYAREASKRAEADGDTGRLARALSAQCLLLRLTSAIDESIETGARALAAASAVGDTEVAANTSFFLGTAHQTRGDFREAAACYRRCVAVLDGHLTPEVARGLPVHASGARAWLAWTLESLGEFGEALRVGRQALEIAEARGGKLGQASVSCLVANVYLGLGDWAAALPLLERAMGLCRSHDLRDWLGPVAMRLGFAYAIAGRVAEGLPLLEEGAAHCETTRNLTGQPARLAGLAHAYLLAGRLVDAERTAQHGVRLARSLRQPAGEASCLRAAGAIAAALNDRTASAANFIQARDIAMTLGMRPLVAHCHLGLGALYRSRGDLQAARQHLDTAAALYREMQMPIWLKETGYTPDP